MIHFEIIECPDLNVRTSFKFLKNEVYIGKSSGDLHIQDTSLEGSHLMMEVPEKDLLIHPQKNVPFYLINGKRCTSIRKARIGDLITIGKTVIKVIAFEETVFPSKKEILDAKLEQLIQQGSSRLPIIEKLTKMMK